MGSPSATRTIDGLQLPAPDLPFGGMIERNALQSTPFWQPRIAPPEGAPNVLLIITDDVGFGAPSTFGGVIPTPALDRIAEMGLRYTNMHSTSLCSPTRAALITGRNHHSAGFGVISEQATGYPGYDCVITKDKATVGTILQGQRLQHLVVRQEPQHAGLSRSAWPGPFDQWPTGMGFDYFYGFMGGDTSQWTPGNLFRNTTQIYPYETQKGFNLITAMADEAIDYMAQLNTLAPEQPWLVYYAPGGTHAPHHPTPEWIKKIEDMQLFDEGWNKLRDTIFANQKKLGVIPADGRTDALALGPAEELGQADRRTRRRCSSVRPTSMPPTSPIPTHEIGRVIDAVEENGDLDNTLIIYISGDNGSSAEGTLIGTPNEVAMFNGVEVPVDVQLKDFYDLWGSEYTYNHMAVAVVLGLRHALQVDQADLVATSAARGRAWPSPGRRSITDKGGIRNQFAHVIDIVPTILEAAEHPRSLRWWTASRKARWRARASPTPSTRRTRTNPRTTAPSISR